MRSEDKRAGGEKVKGQKWAWLNLRYTSPSDGLLSRNRFMVRLGRCDGVATRGAKKPRRAVSIADMELKLKQPLSSRCSDENTEPSSQSDLLRLSTIFEPEGQIWPWWSRQ